MDEAAEKIAQLHADFEQDLERLKKLRRSGELNPDELVHTVMPALVEFAGAVNSFAGEVMAFADDIDGNSSMLQPDDADLLIGVLAVTIQMLQAAIPQIPDEAARTQYEGHLKKAQEALELVNDIRVDDDDLPADDEPDEQSVPEKEEAPPAASEEG